MSLQQAGVDFKCSIVPDATNKLGIYQVKWLFYFDVLSVITDQVIYCHKRLGLLMVVAWLSVICTFQKPLMPFLREIK